MHPFSFTFLTAGSLCLTAGLTMPTNTTSTPGIAVTVTHLDSKGLIDWTPAAHGGRTATIPGDVISQAHQELTTNGNRKLRLRGPGADVGSFTNIGQIAGYAASYACEQSGAYGVSQTIESYATPACTALVAQVPGVPIAEKAWNIYQSAIAPGANGDSVSTIFRFFTNTASAPTLTQSICGTAFEELTSTFCQGKGDKGADTRGGEIKIGSGDDYLVIGLDPNDA